MDEQRYRDSERRLWEHAGVTPDEHQISLPTTDVEVRVQEVGGADDPPVLFVHGGPNAGSTWAPLVGRLEGLRCLVVDRPGTGLSSRFAVDRESLPGFADAFVADLLDGFGIDSAFMVASSFGGYVALRSAAAHPPRVRGIVQMGCPAFAPGMKMPVFMRLMLVPGMRQSIGAVPPHPRAVRMTLRQIGHGASLDRGRIPQEFFDWYLSLQRDTDTMRNEMALIAGLGSVRGFAPALTLTADLLHSVDAPTLFLWGQDDAFGGADVARGGRNASERATAARRGRRSPSMAR